MSRKWWSSSTGNSGPPTARPSTPATRPTAPGNATTDQEPAQRQARTQRHRTALDRDRRTRSRRRHRVGSTARPEPALLHLQPGPPLLPAPQRPSSRAQYLPCRRPAHHHPEEITQRFQVAPSSDYRALAGDTSDNIPGVRGIGAKTAAALLDGGLTLDDLPASGRLAGRKGAAITSAWQQVLTWRDMIRMNNQVPVPARAISGLATTPLPRPAEVIEKLGLWRRVPPAEQNGTPW
ncbi:MAG: polymerase [Actinomycetota bacterium]|nr:polymerase [Actinomycetota bacterium]